VTPAYLVVFGGLPGTGKTTLARQAAIAWRAVYLRIDTIEQALLASTPQLPDAGPVGYAIASAVAFDNLKGGLAVVADCVNPLPVTRDMWRGVAARAGVPILEIEIVCSDTAEHRRRVETRAADIVGHRMPTWSDVMSVDYSPWDRPPLRIDTAVLTPGAALSDFLAAADKWRVSQVVGR
jgi:predicted kinase